MAFQGLNAANKDRRTGQPPVLTTADMDVNFTPQWLLPNKSPSAALPESAKGLSNPPWEPVGTKEIKWRGDDDMKGERWGTGIEKEGHANQNREKPGESMFRGGKWKDDERDNNAAKRDLPRWGAAPDEASRWNGAFNRPQVEPAPRNERWTDASRGRGRPLDEKWTRDRDNLGWLPGMGDEPSNRDKRWNEGGFDQFDASGQEKWRAPGSTREQAPHGRGRGLGRGKPVFKGNEGSERWGSPTRNGQAVVTPVPGSKYNRGSLVEFYNSLVGRHGSPLPLPETADTKLPGLMTDEVVEHENGADAPALSAAVKKKERSSSSDEVHTELTHAPAQAYQPPFKRAPSHPVPAMERRREYDAAAAHAMGHHVDELGVAGGKAAAQKEVAPAAPVVTPQAFAADQWIYKDPQGNIQGPFTKVDILDWFEAGFFPAELPIKSALDPADSPFVNLSSMLKMWAHIGANRAPPGFVQVPAAAHGLPAAAVGLDVGLPSDPTSGLPDSLLPLGSATQPAPGAHGTEPISIPRAHQPQPNLPDSNVLNQLHGMPGATTMQSPFQNDANGTPPNAAAFPGGWEAAQNPAWMPQGPVPATQMLQHVPHSLLPQQHSQPLSNAGSAVPPVNLLHQQHSTQQSIPQNLLLPQQAPAAIMHTSQPLAAMPGLGPQALPGSLAYNQFSLHNAWTHASTAAMQASVPPSQQLPQQFPNAIHDPAVQNHQLLGPNTLHGHGMGLPLDPAIQTAIPKSTQPPNLAATPDFRPPEDLAKGWSTTLPSAPAPGSAAHLPMSAAYPTLPVEPALHVRPVQPPQAPATLIQPPAQVPSPSPQEPTTTKPGAKSKAAAKSDAAKTEPVPATAPSDPTTTDPTPFLEVSKRKKKQQAKAAKAEAAATAAVSTTVATPQPPANESTAARVSDLVPEPPRPETKPAPWAAAAIRPPAQKSLLEIQQEEQARLAAVAAANAAAAATAEKQPAAPVVAPPAPGWAKVASTATVAAPVVVAPAPVVAPAAAPVALTTRPSLREIQEEEERSKQAAAAAQPVEPPVGTGPGPRGSTFGEILASRLDPANGTKPPGAPWASVGRSNVPNLRDVMFEECAADLEGGYVDEDLSDLLPHLYNQQQFQQAAQPPLAAMPAAPATPAAPAPPPAYGVWGGSRAAPQRPPVPQVTPAPPSIPASRAPPTTTAAAPNGPRYTPPFTPATHVPAHEEEEELFWDYGQKQQTNSPAPAAKAAPTKTAAAPTTNASSQKAARAAQPAPAPQPRFNEPARAASIDAEYAEAEATDASLLIGSLEISEEFQEWCRKKMLDFNGNDDLTLIHFLWNLPSGGEVADTCQMYWGNGPAVSSFVAEFMKRKAAEQTRQKSKTKKKGGAAAGGAQASKQSKPGTAGQGAGDDGWHATAKAKGKKAKGKKLDPKMLGFTSHYAVLATE